MYTRFIYDIYVRTYAMYILRKIKRTEKQNKIVLIKQQ